MKDPSGFVIFTKAIQHVFKQSLVGHNDLDVRSLETVVPGGKTTQATE